MGWIRANSAIFLPSKLGSDKWTEIRANSYRTVKQTCLVGRKLTKRMGKQEEKEGMKMGRRRRSDWILRGFRGGGRPAVILETRCMRAWWGSWSKRIVGKRRWKRLRTGLGWSSCWRTKRMRLNRVKIWLNDIIKFDFEEQLEVANFEGKEYEIGFVTFFE